ncbi:ABC transporter ATP-binding protein [Shewanella schlegeliana]|uniref:ABC transporter ATP-binding protein n=1 Tax=Shewanella schlegeliana TaxID=190308 RepID=A0ABS1SYJ8_9GAMM|nr:ABC transporter ATP-binding protein [Shewanella schlegeliana]MBL4912366.1 ABC transporter ATP-binding protein [Shewanella schlegeliana]MCL1108165.1 ABC transporter ATP-binding protein [Shewanella schlegeliana]GIU22029.1 ABC transporter [Shewanella schlegeliana]
MATLQVQQVFSDYQGQVVLKGLDLTVEKGEIVALLGPSGCGKTTLLRAIAGLQAITSGKIIINGRVVADDGRFVASEQRGVGMIFQDYALFPHLTVAENILFGVETRDKSLRASRLAQMLALVKLEGLEKRYPHELSGGQQQRVSIARALAYEPEVLLLDEPFSNIDAKVRREMMLEIREILKSHNVSAVFVTHSKDEAFVFADKLALFNQGQIVQSGDAENLYSTPTDKYVADFLGAGNYLKAKVVGDQRIATAIGEMDSDTVLNLSVGSEAEVLLRPQQLLMKADESGIGEITGRRFLGNVCQYQVQVAENVLDVHSAEPDLLVGQRVAIECKRHSLVLF